MRVQLLYVYIVLVGSCVYDMYEVPWSTAITVSLETQADLLMSVCV